MQHTGLAGGAPVESPSSTRRKDKEEEHDKERKRSKKKKKARAKLISAQLKKHTCTHAYMLHLCTGRKHQHLALNRQWHADTLQCQKTDIFGRCSHRGSLHFRHFNHTYLMVGLLLSRVIKYLPNAQVQCHRCQLQGIIGGRESEGETGRQRNKEKGREKG